tara:strand:+ start:912 stop:1568 length:657 start_codon:yes stop_codon:yes gene_type:complete
MNKIPKRFMRVWIGGTKKIPSKFQEWWEELKEMHPDYEFVTITNWNGFNLSPAIKNIINNVDSYAGISDIARILALYQFGGIYVDTDVKPLKSFNSLIDDDRPFVGLRSSKSFESAIMGSPRGHIAFKELIETLPEWFNNHKGRSASVQTGPAFVSSVLFGREDVRHLPPKTFYPYNGFGAPKRDAKIHMFETKTFPEEMIAAHFSNHRWGGKPKEKI